MDVVVFYEGQEKELSTLIVEWSGPNLLGRDWLKDVKLDWRKLFKMETDGNQAQPKFKTLITQYSEVFHQGLRTFTGPKAKIRKKMQSQNSAKHGQCHMP